MECPYCENGRSFIPGAKSCSSCRDMFENDEIEIGALYHMAGHSVECSDQKIMSGKCVCGVDNNGGLIHVSRNKTILV